MLKSVLLDEDWPLVLWVPEERKLSGLRVEANILEMTTAPALARASIASIVQAVLLRERRWRRQISLLRAQKIG